MRHASLQDQLSEVRSLIQTMCDRVFRALEVLRSHLTRPNSDEILKVILLDNEVDKLEKSIDQKILSIFATQQPLGAELREAYASVKIAHQIERIGDAVESLARQLSQGHAQSLDSERLIERMFDSSMQLFKMSYRAMFEHDFTPVIDIYTKDDEVDRLQKLLLRHACKILTTPLSAHEVESALELINIANRLEKIADISCNWAEQIDFLLHGTLRKKIRRLPQRLILTDNCGGVLAGLMASYLSSNVGLSQSEGQGVRGIEISLATSSTGPSMLTFSTEMSRRLQQRGWIHETRPVSSTHQLNFERVFLVIALGETAKENEPGRVRRGRKAVGIEWPDIYLSPAMAGHFMEGRLGDVEPEQIDENAVEDLLSTIETQGQRLTELLLRMQKPD